MSNIRAVEFRPVVNQELIDMLENALNRAKAGEMMSGGIYGSAPDGSVFTDSTSTENALLEIAAVSRLLHRLHRIADDAMVTE
jgi:hypothetical protein